MKPLLADTIASELEKLRGHGEDIAKDRVKRTRDEDGDYGHGGMGGMGSMSGSSTDNKNVPWPHGQQQQYQGCRISLKLFKNAPILYCASLYLLNY